MSSIFNTLRTLGLALVTTIAIASVAAAHPGHGKPISQEDAVKRAGAEITRLADSGKLDKSWTVDAKLRSAEARTVSKGAKEWALVFSNEKATEADKRTLYVFLSETGEYLAANFTGR